MTPLRFQHAIRIGALVLGVALAGCGADDLPEEAAASSSASAGGTGAPAGAAPLREPELPTTTSTEAVTPADATLAVTTEVVVLNGRIILELNDGKVPAAAKRGGRDGFHIKPLFAALTAVTPPAAPTRPRTVRIAADRRISYRLLSEVVATVVGAGAEEIQLLARSDGGEPAALRSVRVVSAPVAARALPALPPLAVEVTDAGTAAGRAPKLRVEIGIGDTRAEDGAFGAGSEAETDTKIPAGWLPGMAMASGVIRRELRHHMDTYQYCYERGLRTNPKLRGTLRLRWDIDPEGVVRRPHIVDRTFNNSEVEGCTIYRTRITRFPKPEGGRTVEVTFPFLFGVGDELPTPIGIIPDLSMIDALRRVPLVVVSESGYEVHFRGRPPIQIRTTTAGEHDGAGLSRALWDLSGLIPGLKAVGIHMDDRMDTELLVHTLDAARLFCPPGGTCAELFPEPFLTVEP